ncbi:MAG: Flp pilus assembly protein CpaB, partial [Bdellovibrionales bacterium]|nr:Flp pilus assembly protein CpaB [Bdellovibrionales bacterium]
LREVYWPRNQVPPGAIRDLAEVKALYAKNALPQGLPLVRTNLSEHAQQERLPVRPGFVAKSIKVDATSSLEGHALPGSKVDVLLTYVDVDQKATKVIVENATVLSYGGHVEAPNSPLPMVGRPATYNTITLEVSRNDALTIATSERMGELSLILRPMDDIKASGPMFVDDRDIIDGRSQRHASKATGSDCSKGSVRVGGSEYLVNCDETLTQVIQPDEP